MGFLSNIFQSATGQQPKGDITLFAPLSGTLVPLSEVPDIVVSEKVVGDGIAIYPSSNTASAPCDGIITRILASNSAFTIKEQHGIEIYVTIGIAAYELAGEGFERLIGVGDSVKMGQPVLRVDLNRVGERIKSLISPMIVVASTGNIEKVSSATGKCEAAITPISWVILGGTEQSPGETGNRP